jgi:hypothetical protein
MRPAEHKRKEDDEKLFAEFVVDVQHPAAPILKIMRRLVM